MTMVILQQSLVEKLQFHRSPTSHQQPFSATETMILAATPATRNVNNDTINCRHHHHVHQNDCQSITYTS